MKRRRRILRTLGFTALAVVIWLGVLAGMIISFGNHYSATPSDAAVVLGAAVHEGVPSPVYAARLDHAIELQKRGIVRRLVLTGGVGEGDTKSESQAGAEYAIARGVPAERILTESVSRTTHQNLLEARRLIQSAGIGRILLVSDPLHMKRACWMLRDLGVEGEPSPTPSTRYRGWRAQSSFLLREIYFMHHYALVGE